MSGTLGVGSGSSPERPIAAAIPPARSRTSTGANSHTPRRRRPSVASTKECDGVGADLGIVSRMVVVTPSIIGAAPETWASTSPTSASSRCRTSRALTGRRSGSLAMRAARSSSIIVSSGSPVASCGVGSLMWEFIIWKSVPEYGALPVSTAQSRQPTE